MRRFIFLFLQLSLMLTVFPAWAQDPCDVPGTENLGVCPSPSPEPPPESSAPQNSPQWTARYKYGEDDDNGIAVAVAPSGDRVYVAGPGGYFAYEYWYTDGPEFVTIAYDAASGRRIWLRHFDGPKHGADYATAMTLSPDGRRVYVTGKSGVVTYDGRHDDTSTVDFATVAYEASTGRTLWTRRYDQGEHRYDGAEAIAVSADGSRVFVGGMSDSVESGIDQIIVAYDAASGIRLWTARWRGPGKRRDELAALASSWDGRRLFATGWSGPPNAGSGSRVITIGLDARSGARLWARGTSAGDISYGRAIALGERGDRVFVTGLGYVCKDRKCTDPAATFAFDAASGALLWRALDGDDCCYGAPSATIAVDRRQGKVFVTGNGTLAYDGSSGARLWFAAHEARGRAVVVDPAGGHVYVAGSGGRGERAPDYATLALNARTGSFFWMAAYDGGTRCGPCGLEPYSDVARAVVLDPSARHVFITGGSSSGTGWDFTTITYCAEPGSC